MRAQEDTYLEKKKRRQHFLFLILIYYYQNPKTIKGIVTWKGINADSVNTAPLLPFVSSQQKDDDDHHSDEHGYGDN